MLHAFGNTPFGMGLLGDAASATGFRGCQTGWRSQLVPAAWRPVFKQGVSRETLPGVATIGSQKAEIALKSVYFSATEHTGH